MTPVQRGRSGRYEDSDDEDEDSEEDDYVSEVSSPRPTCACIYM